MKHFRLKSVASVLFVSVLILVSLSSAYAAPAAKWPEPGRTFTLVVGYNPGGTVDATARLCAPYIEKYLGIPVVVQNIPGAGGLVGTNSVFSGKSDGYSAVYTDVGELWSYKYLSLSTVPWELSNWKGTGIYSTMPPIGIFCLKSAPWKDFADLIEDARKRPPKSITLASNGPGRINDLYVIEMQKVFGVEFNWVFYEGSGAAQTDMLTGDIDVAVFGVARTDLIDHPNFRVLTGIIDEYPVGCPFRGAYPTLKDFEKRLGYKMADLPAMSIPATFSYIVKADIPDDAYKAICAAIKKMYDDPQWQKEIKAFTWPTYISPEKQVQVFDTIRKTFESYAEIHRKSVPR